MRVYLLDGTNQIAGFWHSKVASREKDRMRLPLPGVKRTALLNTKKAHAHLETDYSQQAPSMEYVGYDYILEPTSDQSRKMK